MTVGPRGPRRPSAAAELVRTNKVIPITVLLPMLPRSRLLLWMRFLTLRPSLMSCLATQLHSTSGLAFKKWIEHATCNLRHGTWPACPSPNIEGGQLFFKLLSHKWSTTTVVVDSCDLVIWKHRGRNRRTSHVAQLLLPLLWICLSQPQRPCLWHTYHVPRYLGMYTSMAALAGLEVPGEY